MKPGDHMIGVVFDAFENGEPYQTLDIDTLLGIEEAVGEHLRSIEEHVRHAALNLHLDDPRMGRMELERDTNGKIILRMGVIATMHPKGTARINPVRAQEDALGTLARLQNLILAILARHRLPLD